MMHSSCKLGWKHKTTHKIPVGGNIGPRNEPKLPIFSEIAIFRSFLGPEVVVLVELVIFLESIVLV